MHVPTKNQNFSPVDKEFACMSRLLNVSAQPAPSIALIYIFHL